jgi:predicted Mrr-cat superfamily restriction endonuclease
MQILMIMGTPQIIKFSGILTEIRAKSRGGAQKSDDECTFIVEHWYDMARMTIGLSMQMFLFYPDRRKARL